MAKKDTGKKNEKKNVKKFTAKMKREILADYQNLIQGGMKTEEAAKQVGVAMSTLKDWAKAEKMPKLKKTGKDVTEQVRELPVELTIDEVAKKARLLTEKMKAKTQLEAEINNLKDFYKGKISVMDGELSELVKQIRDNNEVRPVKCSRTKDYKEGVIFITRLDTKEIISQSPMTDYDRQTTIPGT